MDLSISCKESRDKIREYRQQLQNLCDDVTAEELVHLELAGSMERDLNQMTAEMEKRVLYQLGAMGEQEIKDAGLTERQKEVALLRLRYSYTEIGKMLGMNAHAVFYIFQAAAKKVKKYKLSQEQDEPRGLSSQQSVIYSLYTKGKSRLEISEELNISINTVKTLLQRINKKKKGDKTTEN
jgi:DNA-binding CsgD family transcriptional regulator